MKRSPLITAVTAGGLIVLLAGAAAPPGPTGPVSGPPTTALVDSDHHPLTGTVESVDSARQTAVLAGTASPGAQIHVGDTALTTAAADGAWRGVAADLSVGTNSLSIQQRVDGALVDTIVRQADVTPPQAAPTVDVTYTDDVDTPAQLRGTGEDEATIRVLDGDRLIVPDRTVMGGAWSAEVPISLGAGTHLLTVQQLIGGRLVGSVEQPVYLGGAPSADSPAPGVVSLGTAPVEGADVERAPHPQVGVTVTNPADVSAGYTPDAAFTFRGTAAPGTTLTVQNMWGTHIATRRVDRDGDWSWTRAHMGTSTWQLEFVQDKGGPQEATATVYDFRPRVEQPAVGITAPADISAGYTPDAPYTFRGTGAAGHTISVQNIWGTPVGRAIVDPDGTWQWTRVTMGTSVWYLEFVQDEGLASQSVATVYGFRPEIVTGPAVTVTQPADPALGYEVGRPFTFTGTATPGKTIRVRNVFGTSIASTRVEDDGTWSWTRQYMGTSVWHLEFAQDAGTPAEQFAPVYHFGPRP